MAAWFNAPYMMVATGLTGLTGFTGLGLDGSDGFAEPYKNRLLVYQEPVF